MAKKQSNGKIEQSSGLFTVTTTPHLQRLVEIGWTHVGVNETGASFFQTSNAAVVAATVEELEFEFTKPAK